MEYLIIASSIQTLYWEFPWGCSSLDYLSLTCTFALFRLPWMIALHVVDASHLLKQFWLLCKALKSSISTLLFPFKSVLTVLIISVS